MLGDPEARALGGTGGDTKLSLNEGSPSCGEEDIVKSGSPEVKVRCGYHSLAFRNKGHFPGYIGEKEAGIARDQGRRGAEILAATGEPRV